MSNTPTLYNWTAKRAGNHVTVTHTHGRVTNIKAIEVASSGHVIAEDVMGRQYILHVPTDTTSLVR